MEKNDSLQYFDDDDEEIIHPITHVMKESRLKDFIDDPHQRMIYEYDFINLKTFYIELIKVSPAQKNIIYPICTRSAGQLELKKKKSIPENGADTEDINLEELSIENIFDEGNSDEIQSNINLELDDGFEQFKPI